MNLNRIRIVCAAQTAVAAIASAAAFGAHGQLAAASAAGVVALAFSIETARAALEKPYVGRHRNADPSLGRVPFTTEAR